MPIGDNEQSPEIPATPATPATPAAPATDRPRVMWDVENTLDYAVLNRPYRPMQDISFERVRPDATPSAPILALPDDDATECNCGHCAATVDRSRIVTTVDGDERCEECTQNCDDCGRTFDNDSDQISEAHTSGRVSAYRSNTGQFCDRCAFTCRDCDRRFANSIDEYNDSDGNRICERCAESYSSCDDCSRVVHQDQTHYSEENEQTLCDSCHDRQQRRRDKAIHDYNYKPKAEFKRGLLDKATDKRFFGIEVETEAPDDAEQEEDAENVAASGLFYCKEDGSITDGFEIVSHPAAINYWRTVNLSSIVRLKRDGYRSYDTSTCGMHIHVSRAALSSLDQYKLLYFFRHNAKFIKRASRRSGDRMDRWAAIDCGRSVDFVRKVKRGNTHDGRYTAINFENRNSVEFRIFRGTLSVAGIRRNIEFINALIEFIKSAGLQELTHHKFKRWIATDGKRIIGKQASEVLAEWISHFANVSTNDNQPE